ncbi:MAG: hypothetical protein KBE91_07345 [Bacteroidia bacterium]|nr:hypothetical protein [Bacteroidia bacterium]
MKNFIVKLLIFISLLIIFDRLFLIFRVNETNIFNSIAREKMTIISPKLDIIEKPDILIVGSSHAQFGISPEIIGKQLTAYTLNLAYGGGANIGGQLTMLRRLIEEKKIVPKLIIFGLDVFALNAEPTNNDEFQRKLFKESTNVSNGFFKSKIFNSYFKLYSRFIPRYLTQVKSGNYLLPYFDNENYYDLTMFQKYEKYEISNDGWVMGFGTLNKNYIRYSKTLFNPDKRALANLADYVELCNKNKIALVFIQVPEHKVCAKHIKKYNEFDRWMHQFVHNNKLPYWNFNSETSYPTNTDSLFFDSDHLNKQGAELFSIKLSERIISIHDSMPLTQNRF